MTERRRAGSRAVAIPDDSSDARGTSVPDSGFGRWALFLQQWARNPLAIGSIAPSSPLLSRAVANLVDPADERLVVELGGGTGSVTAALLETGMDPKRLIVVENNPALYELLCDRFPRVRVIQGDATRLEALLQAEGSWGPNKVQLVISGIPLLSMGSAVQERVLRDSVAVLKEGGGVVQFTYSWFVPLKPAVLRAVGLTPRRTKVVWGNVPPASVWHFTR